MAQPTVVKLAPDRSDPTRFTPDQRRAKARATTARAARATGRGSVRAGRATAHGTAVASRATGRAAWRFRAELVPYTAGHGLLGLTAVHHMAAGAAAQTQALGVYGLPAAGAAVVAYLAAKRGGERSRAVLGAAVGAALLLAWAAWVTATGPSWPAYLVLLVLATAVGVVYWPWLLTRRDPRHVEVNLPGHLVPDAAPAVEDPFKPLGLAGAAWAGTRERIASGYAQTLILPPGKNGRTVADTKGPDLAGMLDVGVDDVEVLEDTRKASRVRVLVHTKDLLANPTPWPWLGSNRTDLYDGMPLGLNRAGDLTPLNLIERHVLIAGESGSGKSNVLSMITAAAALDPCVSLWGLDGKITELPGWRPRMTAYVDSNPEAALALLDDLRRTMARRQRILRERRHRNVQRGDDLGLIVLVIDELARFTLETTAETGQKFMTALLDILQVGRSVGVIVVADTQRPSANLLTGDMRAGFTYRLAMRMSDGDGSRMALGDGAGVNAATIDPERRGLGYLAAGTARPRLMRAFFVPDDDLATLTDTAAKVPAPDLPGITLSETVASYDPDDTLDDDRPDLAAVPDTDHPTVEPVRMQRRFPDGHPIRQQDVTVWDALTRHPDGATIEQLQLDPAIEFTSRQPLADRLKAWTTAGYLERIEGRPLRWRRLDLAPDIEAG
ncbi:FtsK/SpoIIIE family protein [Haloactinopolyspora alba]|uniref:FtsK/SpoIIIE family protein n=1 Tax=Haloactinopolyspora alba TaxID=648780 RepID=A0A2P8DF31_9ACTN|nr:FtsK/SpoIIIE domain-containing protein [Haloactinopolyspora alba]PSK95797.1 FtsK/SpoIIIE family protein [Haloactinopolyspora alba]